MAKLKTAKGLELISVEALKVLISLSGMNQRELAEASGLKESQVSGHLSGELPIGPKALVKYAVGLKVSADVLARAEGISLEELKRQVVAEIEAKAKADAALPAADPTPTLEDAAAARHLHALPATDYTLAEANGLFAIESIDEGDERTYRLPIWPEDVAATAFASNNARHATEFAWLKPSEKRVHGAKLRALRVCGDSMNQAGIDAGDVIFVRMDSDATKSQGEIAVISQHDGMTVKRVRGSKGVPESTNPVHREVDIDPDAKLARVVGVHKPASK